MANFAPKLYREYAATMQALFDHHPSLQRNFSNSVFPAASLNCGPETATFEHCDFNNIPHGLCGITCGGKFDHKKGAHLYLKQLKLVVEFPSGSSALIPSGAVDHGNTPLQPGDTRCSITQYAAGGLFRWVKYGFKTAKQLLAEDGGAELKALIDGAPGERVQWALGLFSKPDELAADCAATFTQM
ncbi:hypothetical protein B0H10DRAFT_2165768 [Mycena sp. CBHHK59/15]|nr:hypothetical protein B0H10DRAFT_2165768 [Mycena sp. CBHHK59/15]